MPITRRDLLRIGGSFALVQATGCGINLPLFGINRGVIAFRRSGRGRHVSNAANKHNANHLYATREAAVADLAHPGDKSKVVHVVISRNFHNALFANGNLVADLRHLL